jgi:environmental stress-induced protein Ves
MPIRLTKLDARSHRSMPWKNGGGTTTEIGRYPESGTLEDFDWRVSMARVESSGPFSRFAGVDRSIAILGGDGIVLTVDGEETARLDRRSRPFAFRGDAEVFGTLVGGAVEDLNVMTRRGRFQQVLRRIEWDGAGAARLAVTGEISFVVVSDGAASMRRGGETFELGARDVLRIEGSGVLEMSREEDGDVLCVELQRA